MTNTESYEVLNLTKNSSLLEIRNQYKKLALIYHPDKNGGDDTEFKKIQNAYENLLCVPEYSDYTLFENSESKEILEYLFNIRKLLLPITKEVIISIAKRYNIVPFNKKIQDYIDVLFVRISRNDINSKLDYFEFDKTGSKDEIIHRFLYGKIKKLFLKK